MKYRFIDTALGLMAIGWTTEGVACLRLPGEGRETMRERLLRRGTAEEEAAGLPELAARLIAYAAGAKDDFADVPVDLAGISAFNLLAYEDIRRLGWGETTTYGAVARRLGDIGLARAVGAAMGANPVPLIIPCHRVLGSDGRLVGFSAPGGVTAKVRMLQLERAAMPDGQLSLGL